MVSACGHRTPAKGRLIKNSMKISWTKLIESNYTMHCIHWLLEQCCGQRENAVIKFQVELLRAEAMSRFSLMLGLNPLGQEQYLEIWKFQVKKKRFTWLHQVLTVAYGISGYSMRDLVPWPGVEPGPPALGVYPLCRWTTREVPKLALIFPKLYVTDTYVCK